MGASPVADASWPKAAASTTLAAASWTAPVAVWQSTGRTTNPALVTDAADRVHLFFVDIDSAGKASILYHTLVDGAEFKPVDVLIGINDYRVMADDFGRLHLIYRGDNDVLWYTSVAADQAGNSGGWAPAKIIANATIGSDIVADREGVLYVCMPSSGGVSVMNSSDGGRSWSQPAAAVQTADTSAIATYVRCAVGSEGAFHLAWAEARPPNYYPADGVFYSGSSDGGKTWSRPIEMAAEHHTWPSLVADREGNVHLLWQGDVAVGGRFYRRLAAGTTDWGPVEQPIPAKQGGLSGDAPLAIDGSGHPNIVTSAGGIMWTMRGPSGWSVPVDVAASQVSLPNASASIEYPSMSISQGNLVHASWEFDFKTIYYASAVMDADTAIRTPAPMPVAWATVAPIDLGSADTTGEVEPDASSTDAVAKAGRQPTAASFDRGLPRPVAPDERFLLVGPAVALLVVVAMLGLVRGRARVR